MMIQKKMKKTKKSVTFAKELVISMMLGRNTASTIIGSFHLPSPVEETFITPEEMDQLWYSPIELAGIKSDNVALIHQIRNHQFQCCSSNIQQLCHDHPQESTPTTTTATIQSSSAWEINVMKEETNHSVLNPTTPKCCSRPNNRRHQFHHQQQQQMIILRTIARGLEYKCCYERKRRCYIGNRAILKASLHKHMTPEKLAQFATRCTQWAAQLAHIEALADVPTTNNQHHHPSAQDPPQR